MDRSSDSRLQPGIRPVGVGETWRRLFSNILLKVMGTEATMACQDDQICARLRRESEERSMGFKLYGTKTHLRRNGFLNS